MSIVQEIEHQATDAAKCLEKGDLSGAMVCINAVIGMAQVFQEVDAALDELVKIAQENDMGYSK